MLEGPKLQMADHSCHSPDDSRVKITLCSRLRLAPTPLDRCKVVESHVYCYFEDSGTPVEALIGYTAEASNGSLTITTSGDGSYIFARKHEDAANLSDAYAATPTG